ncbi:uncharacterized protein LOC131957003 [Physella acuta]|uniref:uncharacterized protein LOC131957003 n=1 Tax=Physella acuta TaxID=109671 RepID=UPI0027DC3C61|nr:uncharacterized protein LOC131957003 [Physella acuta]
MPGPNQNNIEPRSDDFIYFYQDRHQMVDRHMQSAPKHNIHKMIPIVDGSQAYIHLKMDKGDPVMMKFVHKHERVSCDDFQPNWVFVNNGTLRFDNSAINKHGAFTCDYFPLLRGPGDYNISYGDPVRIDRSSFPLISNFFKIKCQSRSQNSKYENIHAGIFENKTIFDRLKVLKPPLDGLGMSVAVLVFDSMSRMSWLRRMPRTRSFMVNKLRAVELKGYNIVGDATTAALIPILTGKHEAELPEARRHFPGSKPVDDFPWIWKEFQNRGYVTSWADADVDIAPFNLRLLGFEHQPTDYFMRPFYLAATPTYKNYNRFCHGSEPRHVIWLKWLRDIFHMHQHHPKFLVHFYSPLSHDDNNMLTMADDDLKNFLENLENGGFLNNTLLFVMADHGARYSPARKTLPGKLEERLPYVSLRLPPWFEKKYPSAVKNLRTNVHRLTSPFDLHETFKDVLRYDGAGLGDVINRGISLFKEIPRTRTCEHAGIAPHWCACLAWQRVSASEPDARRALTTAIDAINNLTRGYRTLCASLTISNVTMVSKLVVSEDVLKVNRANLDLDPVMSNHVMKHERKLYQLTFHTEPGHVGFELTLEHLLYADDMVVNPKAISMINKYVHIRKATDKSRIILRTTKKNARNPPKWIELSVAAPCVLGTERKR